MADEISRAVTRIGKVIIHALDMGGDPADAAFEEGEFQIFVAIQQPRTEYAGESGHDREYARQDPVGKVVLEQFVDKGKLQAEVYRDRHLYPVRLGDRKS